MLGAVLNIYYVLSHKIAHDWHNLHIGRSCNYINCLSIIKDTRQCYPKKLSMRIYETCMRVSSDLGEVITLI